jgi:hypothetical protein
MKELFQEQAGETDFKWQAQYGNVIRFKGSFGVCSVIRTCSMYFLIR